MRISNQKDEEGWLGKYIKVDSQHKSRPFWTVGTRFARNASDVIWPKIPLRYKKNRVKLQQNSFKRFQGGKDFPSGISQFSVVLRRRRALGPRPVPGLQQAHPSRRGDESDCGGGVRTLLHPAHQRCESSLSLLIALPSSSLDTVDFMKHRFHETLGFHEILWIP
ncbi:hypothetical protein CEXT_795631 [Caerostris extrusa]|uniref:Uncharacterized protein n=1 Tax=Caerostris extrusa TaxID=172846 RepID=A0AAV4MZ25_CAEEX|nr:hypothetical protein CEXT_795631 [Caerostris extrusa]